jgi:hypothetical protein
VDLVDHHAHVDRRVRRAAGDRGVVEVLGARRVAQHAHRDGAPQPLVRAQVDVALVAVLLARHLAVEDLRRAAEAEIGRRLADVVVSDARDGVVPREGEPDGVRAGEQRLSRELALERAEARRVVERRQVLRRDRGRERVAERAVGEGLGARDDVGLLGDHALVVEARPADERARVHHLGDAPRAAVGLLQRERHRDAVAGAEAAVGAGGAG